MALEQRPRPVAYHRSISVRHASVFRFSHDYFWHCFGIQRAILFKFLRGVGRRVFHRLFFRQRSGRPPKSRGEMVWNGRQAIPKGPWAFS